MYLIALVVDGTTVLAVVVALLMRKAFPPSCSITHLAVGRQQLLQDGFPGCVLGQRRAPRTLQPGETEEELHTSDLIGGVELGAFGVTVFGQIDGEVRGLYRLGGGTISGTVCDGVFRGWWCEG